MQSPAKKRPGRKPKGAQPIYVRFDAKILAQIDKAAKRLKITRTKYLELAAEEKIAREPQVARPSRKAPLSTN